MIESVLVFVCLTTSSIKGVYGSQDVDSEKAFELAAILETTIELTIAMKNLPSFAFAARPSCVTYTRPENGKEWRRYHLTENLSGTNNPVFSRKVRLPYLLKDKQELQFGAYKGYSLDGKIIRVLKAHATCKTADILNAGGRLKLLLKSRSRGKEFIFGKSYAVVYAEKLTNPYDMVTMKLRSENMEDMKICGGPKHYLEIYKRIELEKEDVENEDGYIMVYRTEVDNILELIKSQAKDDEYLEKEWEKISIPFSTLCSNDRERELKFVCLKGADNRIGEFKTTVQEIENYKSAFEVANKNKKLVGEISIYDISINHVPSFAEFIAGGLQLRLTIAIDFSRRKNLIENPESFHYQGAGESKCEKAIRLVVTAFQDFTWNDRYDIRAFGAQKDVGKKFPSETFKLYEDSDDSSGTESLEDTLKAYREALQDPRIRFGGEAEVAPTIYRVVDKTKSYVPSTKTYFVLVVLTAGEIMAGSRMSSLIDHASTLPYLPLSIIFVGIGDVDFSNVKKMFEIKGTRLYQQSSFMHVRGSELESDTDSNAYRKTEMLAALPKHVVSYMNKHGLKPGS